MNEEPRRSIRSTKCINKLILGVALASQVCVNKKRGMYSYSQKSKKIFHRKGKGKKSLFYMTPVRSLEMTVQVIYMVLAAKKSRRTFREYEIFNCIFCACIYD